MSWKILAAVGGLSVIGILAVVAPMVLDASEESPDEGELPYECVQTLIGAGPYQVVPGLDPMPSAPDSSNGAGCTFDRGVSSVTVSLRRGDTEVAWTHHFDGPVRRFGMPLPAGTLGNVPADLALGEYEREVSVTYEDGESGVVRSDEVYLVEDRPLSGRECRDRGYEARCGSLREIESQG